jgi:pescadillo protein
MLTFFEFYETLLSFVLFKLYGELGIRYPLVTATSGAAESEGNVVTNPSLHPTLGGKATSVLAANLSALQVAIQAQRGNSAADAIGDALMQTVEGDNADENTGNEKKTTKAERKKQKKLMLSIDEALKGVQDEDDDNATDDDDEDMEEEEDNVPIAAPLREALEAISDNNGNNTSYNNDTEIVITDPEAQKRHQLFRNLTFFLSREVPRGYLELIILSFGGQVGWEGQDSPIAMDDPSITHHVVDRPALLPTYAKLPKSRDYIQPQWVMDSANFNFVLPIDKYGVGKVLPPHLSPWVDDKEEGYVPKYKEEVERLKNGEVLENDDEPEAGGLVKESDKEADESVSGEEEQVPAHALAKDGSDEKESSEESGSSESEEEDEEAETKAVKKSQTEVRSMLFIFTQPCDLLHSLVVI